MASVAEFVARFRGDTSDAVREFKRAGSEIDKAMDRASRSTERLDNAMVKLVRGVAGGVAFGQIVSLSKEMVKATAQLEDTIAAASVTFGDYASEIEQFASSASTDLGLSKRVALDAANTFATLGKSAGQTGGDLAAFSTDMVALAADLASFRGTSVEDAIMAIGAGLRGESEPLRRFGVLLDDATLKARAFAMGIYEGTGALTPQQKVLAAHAEILAQTTDAQGDFARTSDSTANSLKTAAAEMENAKAAAGEALAPAVTALAQALTPVMQAFAQMPEDLQVVTVNATLAAGAFTAGSEALQGLGVAAKTANMTVGGVVGVLALATTAYSFYAQEKAEATARTKDLADALREEGDAQADTLAAMAKNDISVRRFIEAFTGLGLTTEQVSEYVNSGTGELAAMGRQFTGLQDKVEGIYPELAAFAYNLQGVELAGSDYTEMAQGMTQEQLDSAAATRDFFLELFRLREEYLATKDAADLAAIATGEFKDAEDASKPSVNELKAAIDAQADAFDMANRKMSEQLELKRKLYGDQRDAIERQRDYNDAQVELVDVMGDANATTDDQLDAIIKLSEGFGTLTGASLDSEEGTKRQIYQLDELLKGIDPSSPLYKALADYITQLKNIPTNVDTQLRLNVIGAVTTKDGDMIGFRSGPRALGGPVDAGSVYQVGEGGRPELLTDAFGRTYLIPGSNGVVTPIGGTAGTLGGGGNVTFNITVTNPMMSGEQLANELKAFISRNGAGWLTR